MAINTDDIKSFHFKSIDTICEEAYDETVEIGTY